MNTHVINFLVYPGRACSIHALINETPDYDGVAEGMWLSTGYEWEESWRMSG